MEKKLCVRILILMFCIIGIVIAKFIYDNTYLEERYQRELDYDRIMDMLTMSRRDLNKKFSILFSDDSMYVTFRSNLFCIYKEFMDDDTLNYKGYCDFENKAVRGKVDVRKYGKYTWYVRRFRLDRDVVRFHSKYGTEALLKKYTKKHYTINGGEAECFDFKRNYDDIYWTCCYLLEKEGFTYGYSDLAISTVFTRKLPKKGKTEDVGKNVNPKKRTR